MYIGINTNINKYAVSPHNFKDYRVQSRRRQKNEPKENEKKKRYDRIKRLLTTGESASLGNIIKKKARYEKEGKR